MASPDLDFEAAPAIARERGPPLLARLAECFIAERERWPLWLPVLMGGGIGVYFWLDAEPPAWLGAALVAASLALVMQARRHERALVAPLALLAISLGFAAAQFDAWRVAAPVLERRLGAVMVEGQIVAVDPLPEGARITIAPSAIDRLDAAGLPARVRVRLRHDDQATLPGAWLASRRC